ncbi:hypothetical protein SAMN05216370_2099 [Pseudomonas peli]|uniref:Nucleotidyltransferase domain-containing protein n=1 Tax=Pseudomonas peli TaxID=592361 RepID=A0AB37Z7B3_9PSED|nr:hypothetical protein [Pseudomonas peli]NMZ69713.1 hypothetical protein [Pseudomonas peli]SCW60705.1 hypothetical protein SAMN05216370_2099 [Pseudomonas peli]
MINFENRLASLKNRRQGTAERDRIEKGLYSFAGDQRPTEAHEKLRENAAIKYVIGAMAAVSSESTRISKDEGERVASTLIDLLKTSGISAEMRMQGSVALDIHIEGHSDVDMLILKADIITIQRPALPGTNYVDASDTRPIVEIVSELRKQSEEKLKSRYYAAEVNISGSKSIALSGGSLKRKVDIVPSIWHDTHDYQRTKLDHFRVVQIYDKENHTLIDNKPLLHIKKINERDALYTGNLKKTVRLMKNIIADMPDYKKNKAKKLTSYDIAGIAFAMNEKLNCSQYFPLVLLENLRSFLLVLTYLEEPRNSLMAPDESRKIFNTDEKTDALRILYEEVNSLAIAVQTAISPYQEKYDGELLKRKQVIFF